MKSLIPLLVLSAAVPALCQTSQGPYRFFPEPPGEKSPHTQPRVFPFNKILPTPGFTLEAPSPQFNSPRLDPRFVRRPPQGAITPQQPRTPLAQNLYPGLKLLPLETARLDPIPVYFPEFKMEPIPITSPWVKMVPLQAAEPEPAQKK